MTKTTSSALRALLALLLATAVAGCAGVIEFRVPREFKGKKVKEDPPKTELRLAPAKEASA